MSEDGAGVSVGDSGVPIDWGNGDDDRGILNDTEDIGKDFGSDLEWAGESIGNTWETASDKMDADSASFSTAMNDFKNDDDIGGLGEMGWGAIQEAGDFTAGVIGTVADGLGGLGAGLVAVGHDVGDVAADVGGDIVDGVEDVADDIGDGVEDVIDDIGDLF
jgi:hypothetical protein